MQTKGLKNLFQIQQTLKEAGYIDISRISNEILDYCKDNPTLLKKTLQRISTQEPWEYIRGYTDFCNNKFYVNKYTLIPRIETEQLVYCALDLIKKEQYTQVLDVGTGSGCIIISIVKELQTNREMDSNHEDIKFIGIDISEDALKIAQKNAIENNVNNNIEFLHQDLLSNINSKLTEKTLIIANLPYIPQDIYNSLDSSVKDWEPKTALLGGEDGMLYYNKLIEQAKEKFTDCTLLLEIDPSITKQGYFKNTPVTKDIYGLDRYLLIRLR